MNYNVQLERMAYIRKYVGNRINPYGEYHESSGEVQESDFKLNLNRPLHFNDFCR